MQALKAFYFQIQRILKTQTCGFVYNEPMICCPYGDVSDEPNCDLERDVKSKDKRAKIKRKDTLIFMLICKFYNSYKRPLYGEIVNESHETCNYWGKVLRFFF